MASKTAHSTIKMIVLDLDGTLLNSKLEMTPRTENALKAAIADGVHVVLATGKTRNAGAHLIEKLGIKSPGIYLQGLTIYDPDGTLRWQQTLDPSAARQVLTFGEERGFKFIAYNGVRVMVRRNDRDIIDGIARYHEPEAEIVGPLQNLMGVVPIHKLMAIGERRAITALRWQLGAQLNGTVRLMQAGIPTMLEILPPGASKGNALKVLLKQMNIPAAQVMAMGDAENDVETLQTAGLGIAVGNASESLKAVAKHVVGTNDEDGVAEAVERFVLQRKPEGSDDGSPETMIDTPPAIVVNPDAVEEARAAAEPVETNEGSE